MLRSMYSGITGLRNFQTKLDVIGNNISNVNTYGFKKGRTVFKDLVSQTVAGASAAGGGRGGVNAKQVGLGSQLATIDTLHGQGSTQFTGNTLDLAISGDGFFQVGIVEGGNITNINYTRAGNFYMDSEGYLVNGDGLYIAGYSAGSVDATSGNWSPNTNYDNNIGNLNTNNQAAFERIRIPTDAQSMSISQNGEVSFVDADGELVVAGSLVLSKFPNDGGLQKVGSNNFIESPNSGAALYGLATSNGIGVVESGFLEMSNVDLAEEFTEMIVAQRGFQANTRIITTSDEILQELVNLKR